MTNEEITAALTSGPLADELARRARESGRTYTSQEVAEMINNHQWSDQERRSDETTTGGLRPSHRLS